MRRIGDGKRPGWALLCALILVVTFLAVSYAGDAKPTQAKPMELRFSHFVPGRHPIQAGGFEPWAKAVEERTGGRIKITFYPAQTLCKAKDNYDAVVSGIADIAFASIAYTPGRFPLSEVLFLPFIGSVSAQDCTRIYQELFKKFPQMQDEYSEVKVLWLHTCAAAGLSSNKKPIRRLEDIQKMLVRAPGPLAATVEELGATPVSISAPDTYMAMEKGTVDAMFFPNESLKTLKLYEVTKYHTIGAECMYAPFCVAMNLKVWNSLPPDIQRIIEEESVKAAVLNAKNWDKGDKDAIEFVKAKGHELIYLSPQEIERWRAKTQPLWDKWVADKEAKGLPGKEVLGETVRLMKESKKGS